MLIVIGTKNPAKIKAVETAFEKLNIKVELLSHSVASNVSEMPLDNTTILNGARNRAENIFEFYRLKSTLYNTDKSALHDNTRFNCELNDLSEDCSLQYAGRNENIDYGIGIEGGIININNFYYVKGWVSIFDGKDFSDAGTLTLPFPEEFGEYIFDSNNELGPLMDTLLGEKEINKRQGSVGVMTENILTRTDLFCNAVIAAYMKYHNTYFYKELVNKFKKIF